MQSKYSDNRELSEREKIILHALIDEYIQTGLPVGSRTLSKKSTINLSSATLRNIMADLEEMDYLFQPHTSAGRIPTQRAFRLYVDSILEIRSLTMLEKEKIRQKYRFSRMKVSDIMKETSQILSDISKQISIVVAPKFFTSILKLIELVSLTERRILVILVSQSGMVQNKIIETEEEIPQAELDKYSLYLNDLLKGRTLQEIRNKVLQELKKERIICDRMFSTALSLSKRAFEIDDDSEVYVEGMVNILDYPEFSEIEKMKKFLETFEKKGRILRLLNKSMEAKGIQIFIGSENGLQEMEDCSLITSTYSKGNSVVGTLGVIGPTRIDYERIIPIVDYTAQTLSNILQWM